MTQTTPVLAVLAGVGLVLGATFAIAVPLGGLEDTPVNDINPATTEPQRQGEMTVEESESEHEGAAVHAPPFYASRVITLEGQITLAELPVVLSNVNGEIEVTTGEDDRYSLVANLTGWGSSPEQAREERSQMSFTWDAGVPGERQLLAQVEHDNDEDDAGLLDGGYGEASLVLTVPADVALDLQATSTNGEILVEGLDALAVRAQTTNGEITLEDIEAPVVHAGTTNALIEADVAGTSLASFDTTNGEIDATVTPAEDGEIQADTTNGKITVLVPETSDWGYDVEASTTNGRASIGLEDGDKRTSEDGDEAWFITHNFEDRAIQTDVVVDSTNGDVHVGQAESSPDPTTAQASGSPAVGLVDR